jgi:hypothetical protein
LIKVTLCGVEYAVAANGRYRSAVSHDGESAAF